MLLDKFFKLALITLPFDNLFFAPSSGWATITPILFFVYCLLDFKTTKKTILIKDKITFTILYFIIMYSLFLYLFNGFEFSNFIGGIQTLFLGISIYIAFVNRYYIKKKSIDNDIKVLIFAYSISFVYGVVRYIAMIQNINFLLEIFNFIEKRPYPRLAFSFTEPSFISMHLFGVLLPLVYLTKNIILKKKIMIMIFLFSILTIISKSSTRFLVDFALVIVLSIVCYLLSSKTKFTKKVFSFYGILFLLTTLLILLSTNTITLNSRIEHILDKGIYADASLASRYFRINASIKGYLNEPDRAILGTGIGNSYIFLNSGYDEARKEYKNDYLVEVNALKNSKGDQLFCMHIRLVSEFGLLLYIVFLYLVISRVFKNKKSLFLSLLVFYLYIQFDSYAFYTFWIYLFYLKYIDKFEVKGEAVI